MEEDGSADMSHSVNNYITFNYVWKTIGAFLVASVLWLANDKYETSKSEETTWRIAVIQRLDRIDKVLFIPAIHAEAMK